MNLFIDAWTISAPVIFLLALIISIYFLARFSQKQSNRLFLKIAREVKGLFNNQVPLKKATNEDDPSKLVSYTSLALSSLFSFLLVCLVIGSIMLYAVSEILTVFEITFLPSFFKILFEWILLIISSILLIFAGIYASKLLSYFIYKLHIPHAHLIAQLSSAILLFFSVFFSFRNMDSANSIVNFSILIVSVSLLIALISPIVKLNHLKSNHKSKAA